MADKRKYKAVVIGCSAGGLFALSSVLEKLPANYPLAVIVVQHRSKDANVLFEEILQQRCQVKIKQADEKEVIAASMVYVAPPNYHLLVEMNETFSLSADELVKFSRPSIDILFETAAEAYGNKVIGIVLTGSNSDGESGIRTIRKRGGMTIAQNPEEAQYAAMPLSAIETGAVQRVMKLHDIADFLTGEAIS